MNYRERKSVVYAFDINKEVTLQRLGCSNSAHAETNDTNAATNVRNTDTKAAEVEVVKTQTHKSDHDVDMKSDKIAGLVKNVEIESKAKLDKSLRGSEWDMFADQDNFDNVDVSYALCFLWCLWGRRGTVAQRVVNSIITGGEPINFICSFW